ncbi:hypothetical protein IQ249_19660 [Lusitaniella coriacea LEGE 07157]|uniref:Uncharacterized protein n=1 Tax=Lusitaniella coriacea LEGE 07157 TaxID=945747 RepID=A0A8J7DZG7_9CYAN|nr:hypothetical protein [Lusitaniella coriacea]MBE9118115.1 hypothetical protein [Lusitaniella coriacea LEGE 07157]
MQKKSTKTRRVEIRLSQSLYEKIVAIAVQKNEPIHPRSGKPKITSTLLELIHLGLEQINRSIPLNSPPHLLTESVDLKIQDLDNKIVKLQKLEERLLQLENKYENLADTLSLEISNSSAATEPPSVQESSTKEPQKTVEIIDAEIEVIDSLIEVAEETPNTPKEGLTQLELCNQFRIDYRTLVRDSKYAGFSNVPAYLEARTGYTAKKQGRWWRYYPHP